MSIGNVTIGVIRLCSQQTQYARTGLPTYLRYDVGYSIQGIVPTGSLSVQDTALNYIQTQVPLTTPYVNDEIALARGYQVMPVNSDNVVEVVVSYIYDEIPISSSQWVIETTNYPEMLETDVQYNSSTDPTLVPIIIDNYILGWTDPSQVTTELPQMPARGVINVLKPRKSWTYTKTIYGTTDAQTLDDAGGTYICTVNSVPWIAQSGKTYPVGTIMCYNVAVTYQPYQATNLGVLQFLYRPEGWNPWVRYQNTNFPVPNLWRPSTVGGPFGSGYAANGEIQAIAYLSTNLNTLVNLI